MFYFIDYLLVKSGTKRLVLIFETDVNKFNKLNSDPTVDVTSRQLLFLGATDFSQNQTLDYLFIDDFLFYLLITDKCCKEFR